MAKDRAKTWRSTALGETLFLTAEYQQQRFDRHFHDEFAIGVIDSGCQAFVYDSNRRLDMPKGSVALIGPGVVHAGWPGAEEGWRYRMLYPAAALVRGAVEDVFDGRRRRAFIDRSLMTPLCRWRCRGCTGLARGPRPIRWSWRASALSLRHQAKRGLPANNGPDQFFARRSFNAATCSIDSARSRFSRRFSSSSPFSF